MENYWITSEALYKLLNSKTSNEFEFGDCCYGAYTVGESNRTYLFDRGGIPQSSDNIEKEDYDLIEPFGESERKDLRAITIILFLSKKGVITVLRTGMYFDTETDVSITLNDK